MTSADRLSSALAEFYPLATVGKIWELKGGISAVTTAFEVLTPDGRTELMVAREPGDWRWNQNPDAAADEFRNQQALKEFGLPVASPHYLNPGGKGEGFYILSYLPGGPDLCPVDVDGYIRKYATQLAQIHAANTESADLLHLPRHSVTISPPSGQLNDLLREEEIRAALAKLGGPKSPNQPVLCHGDFWPGNVLWDQGEITGVIDWEEVRIGDPMFDLGICRLDVLWLWGMDAMEDFTHHYVDLHPLDLADLPFWDLRTSLRLMHNLDVCASAYPGLGRPDVTEASMIEGHFAFVQQALRQMAAQ